MYQLNYVPIRLANLNDYFVRYKETKDEKYTLMNFSIFMSLYSTEMPNRL